MVRCTTDPYKIALTTADIEKGIAAVSQVNDQDLLANIVLEAKEFAIRKAALKKLTDQKLLGKVALEAHDYDEEGKEAFNKITDQDVLFNIAMNDTIKDINYRLQAIYHMSNDDLLLKIARGANVAFNRKKECMDHIDSCREVVWNEDDKTLIRGNAISRLNDIEMLTDFVFENNQHGLIRYAVDKLARPSLRKKIEDEKKDKRVQLVCMFIHAFDDVPAAHRERLMDAIAPVLPILNDPPVVKEFGEITSIKTEWTSFNASYTTGTMDGEKFICSIKLKNLSKPLSHSWTPDFPKKTSDLGFLSAIPHIFDLLEPIADRLPKRQ
ncbi:MAG: hypothetical protein NTW10_10835 [Bacteroidetes bacterium]|nr:hypothetical protein [Bacteroidota bacterium]